MYSTHVFADVGCGASGVSLCLLCCVKLQLLQQSVNLNLPAAAASVILVQVDYF